MKETVASARARLSLVRGGIDWRGGPKEDLAWREEYPMSVPSVRKGSQ